MEDFAAQAGEEAGGEGQYRRREPSVDAPNDGFAMAFGIRLRVEGFEANVVGEFYIWHDEHVEASVAFIGTPEQVQEDFIEDVLEEAEDRVRAAQEE
jgi:hypothetical protein